MSQITSYAVTDVGLQRNNNEDTYLDSPEQGLWIVADGMGGHAAGEVASSIATQVIKDSQKNGSSLSDAIQAGHKAILKAAEEGHGGQGMGSTVVVLSSSKPGFYQVGWVGDSRAYIYDEAQNPRLKKISTDHSYVQMLFESGLINEGDMATHPEKNIITQCLGSIELEKVSVSLKEGIWNSGSKILLCSDGLTDSVNDDEIETIIANSDSVEGGSKALLTAALSAGGKDNITVVLIESTMSATQKIIYKAHTTFKNWFTQFKSRES